MPSMQAPDRPRRPMRLIQRTRRSCSRETAHHLPGPVRRVVVDEDHFPGDAGKRGLELAIKLGHIVALVEGGDDDRKRRQVGACLRRVSARSDGFIHARSVYPPHPAMPSCQKPRSVGPNAPKSAEKGPKCQRPRTTGARTSGATLLLRGRPDDGALGSIDVALTPDMGTGEAFRKGVIRLIRDFANDRSLGSGRGRGRGRRSCCRGRRPGRLPELPDRPIDHGHDQHDRRNDPAQDTRHRLRRHTDRSLDSRPIG